MKNQQPELVVNGLLDFLKEAGQTNLLPEVALQLEKLTKESQRVKEIVLKSCVSLDDSELQRLKIILSKLLSIDLPVINEVDKNLLGGFTIKVGDWFLDTSLANEVSYLKKTILE